MSVQKKKLGVASIVIVLFLVFYLVLLLYPYIWGFMTSMKNWMDFYNNKLGFPKVWEWKNYIDVFSNLKLPYKNQAEGVSTTFRIVDMFGNSIVYALVSAFVGTATTYVVAYATNMYDYKFLRIVDGLVLVTMTIPIVGGLASSLQIHKALGLYHNFIGMSTVAKISFTNMYYFIIGASIRSIPKAFKEAAEIDGAGEIQIFVKIMLPLTASVFLTVFLLNFVAQWNDYQTPYIYLENFPTISYGLWWFSSNKGGAEPPMLLAACFIVVLPIVVLFIFFNKKLMQGISLNEGVKE